MSSIWQILAHTPWWVFVLFFYLLKVGIDTTKPHIVGIKKLFILPITLLTLSINSLISSFPFALLTIITYAVSLTFGMIGGWLIIRNLKLSFDHEHSLVKVPGSFINLLLISAIFSTKYYLGYIMATNPDLVQKTGFIIFQLTISGICSGLFLGRLACYLFRKSRSSHENLSNLKGVTNDSRI